MTFKKVDLKINGGEINVDIAPFTMDQIRLLNATPSPELPNVQHWIAITSIGCFEISVFEKPSNDTAPVDEFERVRVHQYAALLASPMQNIQILAVVRKRHLKVMQEESGELLISAYQPTAAVMPFNQEEYTWRFLISKGRCISLMESFSTPPCIGFGRIDNAEYPPFAHHYCSDSEAVHHTHCADIENPQ